MPSIQELMDMFPSKTRRGHDVIWKPFIDPGDGILRDGTFCPFCKDVLFDGPGIQAHHRECEKENSDG